SARPREQVSVAFICRVARYEEHLRRRCVARQQRRGGCRAAGGVRGVEPGLQVLADPVGGADAGAVYRGGNRKQSLQDFRRESRNESLLAGHWNSPGCLGQQESNPGGGGKV